MSILGVIASSTRQGQVSADDGVMFPIFTTTVTSTAASITFSNIPSTYTHLQLRGITITGANLGSDLIMRYNSDTGNNYSLHGNYTGGTNANSYSNSNYGYASCGIQGQSAGPASFICDILEYKNTSIYKTSRAISAFQNNSQGNLYAISSNWRNTNAITTISIQAYPSNNFLQGTVISLYGLLG